MKMDCVSFFRKYTSSKIENLTQFSAVPGCRSNLLVLFCCAIHDNSLVRTFQINKCYERISNSNKVK